MSILSDEGSSKFSQIWIDNEVNVELNHISFKISKIKCQKEWHSIRAIHINNFYEEKSLKDCQLLKTEKIKGSVPLKKN